MRETLTLHYFGKMRIYRASEQIHIQTNTGIKIYRSYFGTKVSLILIEDLLRVNKNNDSALQRFNNRLFLTYVVISCIKNVIIPPLFIIYTPFCL